MVSEKIAALQLAVSFVISRTNWSRGSGQDPAIGFSIRSSFASLTSHDGIFLSSSLSIRAFEHWSCLSRNLLTKLPLRKHLAAIFLLRQLSDDLLTCVCHQSIVRLVTEVRARLVMLTAQPAECTLDNRVPANKMATRVDLCLHVVATENIRYVRSET